MRKALFAAIIAVGILAIVQLVPYGRSHTNPAVRAEPPWDRPQTRELAQRACFDCHSNQTQWPWYSHYAPVSWYLQHDVVDGRQKLNFSEWDRPQKEPHEAAKETRSGKMPPGLYLFAHPEAKLNPAERDALAAGLDAALKGSREVDVSEEREDERE